MEAAGWVAGCSGCAGVNVGWLLGVANGNSAVGEGPGVTVVRLPTGNAVAVGRERGGFCQMMKKLLRMTHNTINPQPSPPTRNLSNAGLSRSGSFSFIELTHFKHINDAQKIGAFQSGID